MSEITVQRERRSWVEVPYNEFSGFLDNAVKNLGYSILATITGSDEVENFGLIYHLAKGGSLLNIKTKIAKDQPVKTITGLFPNADIYEREIADLLGIKVEGLEKGIRYPLPDDWPEGQYPLRKDWKVESLDEKVAGKVGSNFTIIQKGGMTAAGDMKLPICPQHPALKEPESFSVALRGEKIMGLEVRIGYNHRGIEKAAESRSYVQNVYLVERICGICSHTHSTCFVQAVEEIAGLAVPKRALYIRTIIAELERIHSHLLWLGVAGHEVGFDTLLMYSWRDRETVMDLLSLITGNRVNYGINTIGGVRRDIDPSNLEAILKAVDKLEEQTKYYVQVAFEETTLINRLSKVGKLTREDTIRLGAVGPTARASGVDRDVRRDDPYAAYGEMDFKVITDDHCDVYGRTIVRLKELMESYKIIRQAVKNLPDGPIAVRAPRKIPAGEAVSRYEAPRGEDIHYVKANGTENPERLKVRAPTLANIQAVSKMLEYGQLADLPITVAAIDPCFSCTDRAIKVNDVVMMNWEELRAYGIEWYKKRGVDFGNL